VDPSGLGVLNLGIEGMIAGRRDRRLRDDASGTGSARSASPRAMPGGRRRGAESSPSVVLQFLGEPWWSRPGLLSLTIFRQPD